MHGNLGSDTSAELYQLDEANRTRLMESAPLMEEWSNTKCAFKDGGGMEEWAKSQTDSENSFVFTCDWYHGTWQFLRLLNMVAVPPWYGFYRGALSRVLAAKPDANVLISAAADYGMLRTLHEAITASRSSPTITLYDICMTPLLATQWYAELHGLEVTYVCDDLLRSPTVPTEAYDLVVTDEFLTVLKDPDKPLVADRWCQFLRPGGVLVTTAMIGLPTTPELREGYAARARRLLARNADTFLAMGVDMDTVLSRIEKFAARHTRHMLTDETQLAGLLSNLDLRFTRTTTPGECVNPTDSFQIVASKK